MSFISLDCSMNFIKLLSQDSHIAKTTTCNRTKATAIMKNVLSPLAKRKMMNKFKEVSFVSVSCDTSNHGSIKLLPILIQYYHVHNRGITTKILEILEITDETSDTITDVIQRELEKHLVLKNFFENIFSEYLWKIVPLEEFNVFDWMDVNAEKSLQCSVVEPAVEFLWFRNIKVNDEKLFIEFLCFQKFIKDECIKSVSNCIKLWCHFFENSECGKKCNTCHMMIYCVIPNSSFNCANFFIFR
ncbi:hypothetical protein ALC57_11679 [Trachymyrmex cornetzi]|uniref:Uncharacterized protein n=1 Tax=Trachymyrmex cornetzi TaxID=471704 RepID=A0A151J2A6_9HYME|nr:hypothetical protein ALC57_11679 [Trachymyrmex cornetzi]